MRDRIKSITFALIILLSILIPTGQALSETIKSSRPGTGKTIPDFTLPLDPFYLNKSEYDSSVRISFNKDIKGKSKIIIIIFMTPVCSACTSELNLISDIINRCRKSSPDAVKGYIVNRQRVHNDPPPYRPISASNYPITYYMNDPDGDTLFSFGFEYNPSLVITDGDGRLLFLLAGYTPATDAGKIINVVKDALKEQGVKW